MHNIKFMPSGSRVCLISVYSYDEMNLCGVLENPNLEGELRFDSTAQLLLAMDKIFDDIGNPLRSMSPRGFKPEEPRFKPVSTLHAAKPLAAFRVDVMFRQNASWQGSLIWLDKKKESRFRSVLELIMIINTALGQSEASAAVS